MADVSRRGPNIQGPRTSGRGPAGGPKPGGTSRPASGGGRGDGGGREEGQGGSAIAAVPWYVGAYFDDAPPGHRYFMYLPFWQQRDWSKIKEGKAGVLRDMGKIRGHIHDTMTELARRQCAIGEAMGAERIEAVSISPFATGLGWEHPNENGFAFLHPYGLPYLAGSGVKGVLRDAARELAEGRAGETHGWTLLAVTELFGPMPEEIEKPEDASRGALQFFDVMPEIAGQGLGVDIMNPHYGSYYEGTSTPHDAGSPVPVFFLVVPPGSKFTFIVDCPRDHRLSQDLRANWRAMIRAAFNHAFDWLGFGAKTAVGYGAMATHKPESAAQAGVARGQKFGVDGKPAAASMSSQAEEAVWDKAALLLNPGTGEIKASFHGKTTAGLKGREADAFRAALGDRANKLKKDRELKNVAVRVRIEGNMITLLGLVTPEE